MGRRTNNVLLLSVIALATLGAAEGTEKDKKSSSVIHPPAPVVDSAEELGKLLNFPATELKG